MVLLRSLRPLGVWDDLNEAGAVDHELLWSALTSHYDYFLPVLRKD